MSKTPTEIAVSAFMPGKIIDGYTKNQSNMGAAMALSAFDTAEAFFSENDPYRYDVILTGDLGEVGSGILCELFKERLGEKGSYLASIHKDCGTLLYDKECQDVHSGASGCGCSASVMAAHILPMVRRGEIKRLLLMSTGALMSTSSVCQGENILGVTPLIQIEHNTDL